MNTPVKESTPPENNAEIVPPGVQPKKVGSALQELAYDLTYRELDDRQAERWVRENWQTVLGMLAVVMLALWTWEMVGSSRAKAAADTSEKFSEAQKLFGTDFRKAVSASEGVKPDSLRALNDTLAAVSEGSAVYPKLSALYDARIAFEQRQFAVVREKLAQFRPESLTVSAPQAVTSDRLVRELASLLNARTYLEEGNTVKARELLIAIARSSDIVGGEAVLALLRLSSSKDERANAEAEASALFKRRPELRESVQRELESFGIDSDA